MFFTTKGDAVIPPLVFLTFLCLFGLKAKCFLYIADSASRDCVESQRKGVVLVTAPNAIRTQIRNRFPFVRKTTLSTPSRLVAGHHFISDSAMYWTLEKALAPLWLSGFIPPRLIRHKFHIGLTESEVKYCLLGYGIPIQCLPWTDTGKIKVKHFSSWMKIRVLIESGFHETENGLIVECPGMNDVLFRHGQSYKENFGNEVLREWIENEIWRKTMASPAVDHNCGDGSSSSFNDGKTSIERFCDNMIDEIQNNRKGCFLRWDGDRNAWVCMLDRTEIKKKISASFYNYAKRNYNLPIQLQGGGGVYQFIEGRNTRRRHNCFLGNTTNSLANNNSDATSDARKRQRNDPFNN